jgi:hypothetical protein
MIGFLIGTVCLIGLFKVIGGHRGCHHGRHRLGGRRYWAGGGERMAVRWLFERLDTTHGQEKVILEAIDELRGPWGSAREELRSAFGDLGRAVRGAEFDHGGVAETWVRQDRALEQVRLALTTSLARIHEALDERQRRILADLIERGPRWV